MWRICLFFNRRRQKLFYLSCMCFLIFPFYFLGSTNTVHFRSKFKSFVKTGKNARIYNFDLTRNVTGVSRNHRKITKEKYLFSKDFILNKSPITNWLMKPAKYCGEKFVGYAHLFADLYDVRLDPTRNNNHKGGENIDEVKNQPENSEYLTLNKGFFKLSCPNCKSKISDTYNPKEPKSQWLKSLECLETNHNSNDNVNNNFVIAVQRYEYVNVYHTMTDWYNTFLMTLIFKQDPQNTTILWMDAHPKGSLDIVWRTLFGSTMQASRLNKPIRFRRLIWSINGYESLINQHHLDTVPYLEEFRDFFLKTFNVNTSKEKNCLNLNILFLLRHDYVAHPRNMRGVVKRKIENEGELIKRAKQSFPSFNVSGRQLDSYSFSKQLNIIANTDILIGMHGAGLTMSIFLPSHAGLIELFPSYFSPSNIHFKSIARWRNLKFARWQNKVRANERKNYNTYIPPQTVIDLIHQIKNKMCNP